LSISSPFDRHVHEVTRMVKEAQVDEVLLHRARQGDAAALVDFATRWWGPVYRIALNMLGSPPDAAEATEQTFRLALRFPEAVGYHGTFGISLRSAAMDMLLLRCPPAPDFARESLDAFLPRFDGRGFLASAGEDWSVLIEEIFRRPDLPETIRRLLQRLDAVDRAVFVLRVVEQFSIEETVAILRMGSEEVRARAHRATAAMAGLLGRTLPSSPTAADATPRASSTARSM
jgi:DNA-directed RNA polymerase specialized sigma24 family protein